MKQFTLSVFALLAITFSTNAQTKKVTKAKAATKKVTTTVSKTTKVDPKVTAALAAPVKDVAKQDIPVNAQTTSTFVPDQSMPKTPVQDVPQIDAFVNFDKTEHNFGNVPEGPQAITEFKIKNISNEPITINNVQASCGCTVPEWTKEPIAPGATGKIKAIYNTQGRPGTISKSLTVTTSKGTKSLALKGNVEKAPETSVPVNNNSMIKTN